MDRDFGGVIWTNHALDRLKKRGISQGDAWVTFNRPEQSRYATAKAAWVYYRTYGSQRIEVVAKKNEKGEWLILSVWNRPVDGKKSQGPKTEKSEPIWKLMIKQILGR
jgi:hypothetical protein